VLQSTKAGIQKILRSNILIDQITMA